MLKRWGLLVVVFVTLQATAFAAGIGKITGLKGAAQYRAKNNIPYEALAAGASIAEGGWIKTGPDGWVELTLDDKSKFTLANNSEFEVTSFKLSASKREGVFNLSQGKLRASVPKFSGKLSGMTVKSGTAVAGIKGTEFLMLSQGPANVFFGNEGTVAVSGAAGGAQQPLTASSMTQNTRSETPVEPLKIASGTPVAEAKGIFDAITAAVPPADWTDSGRIADIIARWNINHGHYLADSGNYQEALHVFQIALDLTKVSAVRADAHMERGAVYARFLSNPELALAEYLLVLEEYPDLPQAESALFQSGQTLAEMGYTEQAKARFGSYQRLYPSGRHRDTVDTLIRNLGGR